MSIRTSLIKLAEDRRYRALAAFFQCVFLIVLLISNFVELKIPLWISTPWAVLTIAVFFPLCLGDAPDKSK